MILTPDQVQQLAYNAGFRGTDLTAAVEIANCESSFNTNAHCLNCFPGVTEDSRGLWQINLNAHPEFQTWNLFDGATNALAAWQIYNAAGKKFNDWSCSLKITPVEAVGLGGFAILALIVLYFISVD